jgi:hypothetical protein
VPAGAHGATRPLSMRHASSGCHVSAAAGGAAAHATGTGIANALIGDSANDDALEAERQGLWDALKIQEQGSGRAMDYQATKGQEAINAFLTYAARARADLDPYRKASAEALKQQQGLTDPNSPIYQQQRAAMTSQIQRQLAAQGLLRSKNQSRRLTTCGQRSSAKSGNFHSHDNQPWEWR